MTNISKSKTNTKEFEQLYKELASTLSNLNMPAAQAFINELLTESERIMLIKRFGALVMFKRGYSQYQVWNTLHISPATAQRIYNRHKMGEFAEIENQYLKKEVPAILSFIEKLIRAQGRERWLLLK